MLTSAGRGGEASYQYALQTIFGDHRQSQNDSKLSKIIAIKIKVLFFGTVWCDIFLKQINGHVTELLTHRLGSDIKLEEKLTKS